MKNHPFKRFLKKSISKRLIRNHVVWVICIFLLIWVAFFDSHSVYKRATWYYQAKKLESENHAIQRMIDNLDHQLNVDISEETIEKIARERYGMRRDGETVYPVKVID